MLAFQLQFSANRLDLSFIASITPGCAERLLYINLMCSRHLLECARFVMNEDQRYRYITLQEGLLFSIEQMHDSHIAMRTHSCKLPNENMLYETVESILELRAELMDEQLQELLNAPQATMLGEWPVNERFVLMRAAA